MDTTNNRPAKRARRAPTKGDKIALALLVLGLGGLVAAAALDWGGRWVDKRLADAEGTYATAWVQTQEVAPGDPIAVHVVTSGGRKSVIAAIRARLGDLPIQLNKGGAKALGTVTNKSTGDNTVMVLTSPDTLALGDTRLRLDVDEVVALDAGGGTYGEREWTDHLELNVELLSNSSRTVSRALSRLFALLAWMVGLALAYAIGRWGRGAPILDEHRVAAAKYTNSFAVGLTLASLLALAVLGMVGQLAFVRPIGRTTSLSSQTFITAVQLLWICGLVVGAWLGIRARRRDRRWMPVRIRAVMGAPLEVGYRDPGSALPASIPRCAERRSAEQIVDALRAAGFIVSIKGWKMQIASASGPMMRLRAHSPAPWAPEDLSTSVLGNADASGILRALVQPFGPLQYTSPRGVTNIVDTAPDPTQSTEVAARDLGLPARREREPAPSPASSAPPTT